MVCIGHGAKTHERSSTPRFSDRENSAQLLVQDGFYFSVLTDREHAKSILTEDSVV